MHSFEDLTNDKYISEAVFFNFVLNLVKEYR